MWESALSSIVLGIVTGLTVSVIWAVLVASLYWLRNWNLEKCLRHALTPRSVSFHADGSVGIVITNPTNHQVTIRGVGIVGGKKEGARVELSFQKDFSRGLIFDEQRRWVDLPPHTEGNWSYNLAVVRQRGPERLDAFRQSVTPVSGFSVTIEYKTLLGTTRVIDIEPDSPANRKHITDSFQRYFEGKELPFSTHTPPSLD